MKYDEQFAGDEDDRDEELVAGLRASELHRLSMILRRTKLSLIEGLVEIGITTGYLSAASLVVIREKLEEWYDCSQNSETKQWGYANS